ncbi:MAG TPA: hypothetical protein VD999_05760 [Vitreimonas sp.]|nr:hypothetical protein [Vitreimonas sp.]
MATQFGDKKLKLKYLFTAFFEDGHVISQTPEDVSTIDPEKRSAFFDVLEYEKKSKLMAFNLLNPVLKEYIEVNLNTGEFDVHGIKINIADQNFEPTEPLRLVYFRETRIESDVKMIAGQKDDLLAQRFYVNNYFIGWQTTVDGKNVQRTIALGGT